MESFTLTPKNLQLAHNIIKRYPLVQSALIPILDVCKRQLGGYLTPEVSKYVAQLLNLPVIAVIEVVNFYTMFYQNPQGKFCIELCKTTPCYLMGSDNLKKVCQKKLNLHKSGQVEGQFSLHEVECLGACSSGPVVKINQKILTHLTPQKLEQILNQCQEKSQEYTYNYYNLTHPLDETIQPVSQQNTSAPSKQQQSTKP